MRVSNVEHYVPIVCGTLIFSIGLLISLKPAITRPHFIIGAQKWIVLGPKAHMIPFQDYLRFIPAGWLINWVNLDISIQLGEESHPDTFRLYMWILQISKDAPPFEYIVPKDKRLTIGRQGTPEHPNNLTINSQDVTLIWMINLSAESMHLLWYKLVNTLLA